MYNRHVSSTIGCNSLDKNDSLSIQCSLQEALARILSEDVVLSSDESDGEDDLILVICI